MIGDKTLRKHRISCKKKKFIPLKINAQVLITSWVVIAILLGSATLAVRNPQTIPTDGQNFFEYVLDKIVSATALTP